MVLENSAVAQGLYVLSVVNGLDFTSELIKQGIVPSQEIDSFIYLCEDPWLDENSLN